MRIRVFGVGEVTVEEYEQLLMNHLNGGPEPELEGTPEEQFAIDALVADRAEARLRRTANGAGMQ